MNARKYKETLFLKEQKKVEKEKIKDDLKKSNKLRKKRSKISLTNWKKQVDKEKKQKINDDFKKTNKFRKKIPEITNI